MNKLCDAQARRVLAERLRKAMEQMQEEEQRLQQAVNHRLEIVRGLSHQADEMERQSLFAHLDSYDLARLLPRANRNQMAS